MESIAPQLTVMVISESVEKRDIIQRQSAAFAAGTLCSQCSGLGSLERLAHCRRGNLMTTISRKYQMVIAAEFKGEFKSEVQRARE